MKYKKPIYEIPLGTKYKLTIDQRQDLLKNIVKLMLQKLTSSKLIFATCTSQKEERDIHQYDYLLVFENPKTNKIAILIPARYSNKSIDGFAKAISDDKITGDVSDTSKVSLFLSQCISDLIIVPTSVFRNLEKAVVTEYYMNNPTETDTPITWKSIECRSILFDRLSAPILIKT